MFRHPRKDGNSAELNLFGLGGNGGRILCSLDMVSSPTGVETQWYQKIGIGLKRRFCIITCGCCNPGGWKVFVSVGFCDGKKDESGKHGITALFRFT